MKSTFSFYGALWIRIITGFRGFHIGNTRIKAVKAYLFDTKGSQEKVSLSNLEPSTLETVINDSKSFLILQKDTAPSITDQEGYLNALAKGNIDHHFSL